MSLARCFYLATWHAVLAITKRHFMEATASACRVVALVIVTPFTVSQSLRPLPYLQLVLFVYSVILIERYCLLY